jgi:filamentous hemagglutinin family protein
MILRQIGRFALLMVFCLETTLTVAEVVLDGTLGPVLALDGPNFDIRAELGQQQGGNLFHSFHKFNLNKNETATFLGPNTVRNVISRITGGKSTLNGKLHSEIPQVNLYLINSKGFLLGPNAQLDLQGSFHLSTANQLYLGDTGLFDSSHPNQSVLVSAPPSAFGFLEPEAALIEIQGSKLATQHGKTLSILGGEIRMVGGHLRAVSGRINLAAIAQANQLVSKPDSLLVDKNAQLGQIALVDHAIIDAGKPGTGDIFIRGGQFILEHSGIIANTESEQDNGVIAIEVNELQLKQGADIDSRAFGSGQGGQIIIKVAGNASLSDQSSIRTSSLSTSTEAGNAGNISFNAQNLNLFNSIITTTTFGPGLGGDITLEASHEINLISSVDFPAAIQASSRPKNKLNAGDAGRIFIQATDLNLLGPKSQIDNSTLGAGQGGNITLDILSTLRLSDDAFISADSLGLGNAGNIYLNALNLEMDRSTISTAAQTASGGNIILNTRRHLNLSSSSLSATVSGGIGNGGNLAISNPCFFNLIDSSIIANASGGNGGIILIITNSLMESINSSITASSETGLDGEVKIDNIYNIDLNTLPIDFLDVNILSKKHCITHTDTQSSNFFIKGRGGLPNAPDDLQIYIPMEEPNPK